MRKKGPERHVRPKFVLVSPFCDEVWSAIAPRLEQVSEVTIVRLQGERTIEDHAASIAPLIDERSYIMGFCSGGAVALAVTRTSPHVAGIVLLSTMPLADTEQKRRTRLDKMERLRSKVAAGAEEGDASYAELAAGWMLSRRSLSDESICSRAKKILGEVTPRAALDNHMAMLSRPDLSDDFLRFAGPLLMFVGQQDRILDVRSALALVARAPRVQAIILPDCGHMIPTETPDLVVSAIEDWMKSL